MSVAMLAGESQTASASVEMAPSGLQIGAANSALEQEADRIADEITKSELSLRWPESTINLAAPLHNAVKGNREIHGRTMKRGNKDGWVS